MRKIRLWLLLFFGKLDNPEEFDYFVIMVLAIIALFLVVTWYLFVILQIMHEMIDEYLGELMSGLGAALLASGVAGYRSLFARIKKLEETQIKMQGEINLNSALDHERAK